MDTPQTCAAAAVHHKDLCVFPLAADTRCEQGFRDTTTQSAVPYLATQVGRVKRPPCRACQVPSQALGTWV